MSIEAYDYGKSDGIAQERARIREWVLANRRAMELDDDLFMYRDSFNSEDLLRFIDGNEDNEEETVIRLSERDHAQLRDAIEGENK